MRKAIPTIHESAAHLKQLLKHERQPAKQQRLHALSVLARGQARYRHEVATLLGGDRNTVGRWRATYERGGLSALLDVYIPAGKRTPLTPEQIVQLQQALAQPHGFAAYGAMRQWLADTFAVHLTDTAVHKLVRYKLRAKLQVPRPSQIKKRRRHRYL